MPSPTILIVDDEETIREVVRRYLELDGFAVREAADGYTALDEIALDPPDLIVLDLMLPGIDGLTITRQLRERAQKTIPIIMLTARGETSDRIRGLDLGADDYIAKPFSPREVVSRVNAVLRRTGGGTAPPPSERLDFGELSIDPVSRSVTVQGRAMSLSLKEFDLLLFLAQNPRRVFSRTQLLENVWGYEAFGDASTVTVHIRRVREKIEPDPGNPQHILTVWGVGYKFED